jgi:hypothetical protein
VLLMCMLTYLHSYLYLVMIWYCLNVLSWNQSVEQNKRINMHKKSSSCPRCVGQSVMECVVKPLRDVKVTGLKLAGTKNPSMLRVGVAHSRCNPRVILTAYMPLSCGLLATG